MNPSLLGAQDNTLLHQVFNFQPLSERPEKLSAWEKRMYRQGLAQAGRVGPSLGPREGVRGAGACWVGSGGGPLSSGICQ
jgi:hypothetical protein